MLDKYAVTLAQAACIACRGPRRSKDTPDDIIWFACAYKSY